jgi:thiamine pyrophosphate-dependent acetolactate synthase large subunit-like protein
MTRTLLRTEAVEVLARARGTMLSVVTMQAVAPWNALGQADERNFNVVGCMGSAGAVGLGLALAQPGERVLVLDGDGSLLMQLATLVSVADRQPRNLHHVVFENGIYETSGGQKVPGHATANLPEIALASGYRYAVRFASVAEMDDGLEAALRQPGPGLISLIITAPGTVVSAPSVPNKATQIENMRLALGERQP